MNLDDRICYCYHVPLRKLVNYARRERPARASMMRECLDAGTGCGWCIPFLKRIHADPDHFESELTPEQYEAKRAAYRTEGETPNSF